MKTESAIEQLRGLLDASDLGEEPAYLEWRSKVAAILRDSFGANGDQLREFIHASALREEGYTTARGRRRDLEHFRADASVRGKGVIRAAIFALEVLDGEDPLDAASIDPELWLHVQGLIAGDDWSKVPASVAIFLEDKVRGWASDPRDAKDGALVGKSLYGHALNDAGPLRLGGQQGEWEGWRFLGMGLAQAIGNVDRHRIQRRDDLRRYAMGVLGLGSLLLTQLRYERAAAILEAESMQGEPEGQTSE